MQVIDRTIEPGNLLPMSRMLGIVGASLLRARLDVVRASCKPGAAGHPAARKQSCMNSRGDTPWLPAAASGRLPRPEVRGTRANVRSPRPPTGLNPGRRLGLSTLAAAAACKGCTMRVRVGSAAAHV